MNDTPKWKKNGHRSLRRSHTPRIIVRFRKRGEVANVKFLESEAEFNDRERAAGRDPVATLSALQAEAVAVWTELQKTERINHERKDTEF